MRLPDALHEIENAMRERIRHYVKRGKIECYLRYQPSEDSNIGITVNTALVKKICEAMRLSRSH